MAGCCFSELIISISKPALLVMFDVDQTDLANGIEVSLICLA